MKNPDKLVTISIKQEAWVKLHKYARERGVTLSWALNDILKGFELTDEEYLEELKLKRGK